MTNDYKADLFIMLPFNKSNNKKGTRKSLNSVKISKKADAFIKELMDISNYECSDSISSKVDRKYVGMHKFICTSDVSKKDKVVGTENCYLFLTAHKKTNLYIAIVMFVDIKLPVTFVLDQVSREDLRITVNNQEVKLYDYLIDEFNFERCGKPKTCICLSNYPKNMKEMLYLAAGEAFGSDEVDFELISRHFKSDISKNIAQFDFCDIYASRMNIIQINKRFSEDYFQRIYYEALLIFIAELVLFKEAAIHRTNQRVIYEIERNSKPPLKLIEKLSMEFGSTIGLWSISNFRYNAVQCLAKDIEDAFRISELMEAYNNNQNYLEHIINIRNIQVSEREGKILNFIAIILTLIQTIPLISAVFSKTILVEFISWRFGLLGLTTLIVIILIRKRRMDKLL